MKMYRCNKSRECPAMNCFHRKNHTHKKCKKSDICSWDATQTCRPLPSTPRKAKSAKVRRPETCGRCPLVGLCNAPEKGTVRYQGECILAWRRLFRYMAGVDKH